MARERPSTHGAIVGEALAQIAESVTGALPKDCCATCAFRRGCMTNQMASTGLVAWKCAIGADPDPFACHHGMVDGEPTKVCAGWLAAKVADFEDVKRISAEMLAKVNALPDDGLDPDPVREAFDAWIERVDPDHSMDDYRRGRLYLRHYGTDTYPASHTPSDRRGDMGGASCTDLSSAVSVVSDDFPGRPDTQSSTGKEDR
jgi:hypothetical protein